LAILILTFLISCGEEANMAISPDADLEFTEDQIVILDVIYNEAIPISNRPL